MPSGGATASVIWICRRPRSGSGPPSPRVGGSIRFDRPSVHGIVIGWTPWPVFLGTGIRKILAVFTPCPPARAHRRGENQSTEGARDDPYRACRCSACVRRHDVGGAK